MGTKLTSMPSATSLNPSDIMYIVQAGVSKKVTASYLGMAASPSGCVSAYAGATAPSGWLECDGSAVLRTTYASLFAAIGILYGAGDGSTTFNLPDLRGVFVRGWDHGKGTDAGRTEGSEQLDAMQKITGSFGIDDRSFGSAPTGPFAQGDAKDVGSQGTGTGYAMTFDTSRVVRTASETRPINVAMMYIIKI